MTLNAKIGAFTDFSVILGCDRDTFKERSASNSLQIDQDKLHMKLLALNVDFNNLRPDLLGSRKPAHKGIKSGTP